MMKEAAKKPRGKYNPACDVCARKKTKCDGQKPVCQPCVLQGRSSECAWTKNPARKPRTEQHFEAMYKRAESLKKRAEEYRRYAGYLESLMDQCRQHTFDFRASRPSDSDGLLGQPLPDGSEFDFDFSIADDQDGESESGNDPMVKDICIPAGSLKIEEDGLILHHGLTAPFRFGSEIRTLPSRFPALAENPEATYVLIVDGVNDNCYNPDFDWSRHLPTAVPLDRRSHDKALDLLFKFFTSWCLRMVPALFLRDMCRALSVPRSHTPPKTPHYSPMLHNALIALALAFLDDERFRDLKARQYFANTAKSFIEAECQKPNLSVVHALSIIASFHSSQGDQTLGYMYFGISARMSQALGLNVDCSDWVKLGLIEEADRLDRHWANWTTFTQDRCWSLYVGRDFCVPDIEKGFPLPIVDTELDKMPWIYPPANIDPQPNHLTSTFRATCELLIIASRIMDVVNGLNKARSRPFIIDDLISDIDLKLNAWRSSLAPELEITVKSRPTSTPHKLMLHLSYWWLFILLHRPFFHRKARPIHSTDREIDHVKLCRRAADNIMELLGTWRSLYTLRYCPITLIQTVFSAGTIWLLTGMQASSGIRIAQKELRNALDQQRLVMQYLQEIGKSWQCATNIAGILKTLMNEQLKPLLERKFPLVPRPSSNSGGLSIPDDDEDEVRGTSLSRSSSKNHIRHRSSSSRIVKRRPSSSHNVSASQSSVSLSPTITVFPVQDPMPHASGRSPSDLKPSSPITIHRPPKSESTFSDSPSSISSPWASLAHNIQGSPASHSSINPSPGSSPVFSMNGPQSTSFVQRSFQGYAQPFSAAPSDNNLFARSSAHDLGTTHTFAGQGNIHVSHQSQTQSSSNHYPEKELAHYTGMLGGQALPEAPFFGPLDFSDEIEALSGMASQNDFLTGCSTSVFGHAFRNYAASTSSAGDNSYLDSGADMDTDFNLEQDFAPFN